MSRVVRVQVASIRSFSGGSLPSWPIPVEGIEGKRERALPQGYRVIANKVFPHILLHPFLLQLLYP